MDTPSNVEAIAQALASHRDALIDGAVPQLVTLWSRDLVGATPEVAAEVVRARLADPAWSHFRRDGARPAPAAQQQQQQAPGPYAAERAARQQQAAQRMDDQFKANIAASRATASPGLTGTYGR